MDQHRRAARTLSFIASAAAIAYALGCVAPRAQSFIPAVLPPVEPPAPGLASLPDRFQPDTLPEVAALTVDGGLFLINSNANSAIWRVYGGGLDPRLMYRPTGYPAHRLAGTIDGAYLATILPTEDGTSSELNVVRTADWSAHATLVQLPQFQPRVIAIGPRTGSLYLAGEGRNAVMVVRYDLDSLRLRRQWHFPWPQGRDTGSVVALVVDDSERSLYISYGTGADRVDLIGDSAVLCRRTGDAACIAGRGPVTLVGDRILIAAPDAPMGRGRILVSSRSSAHADSVDAGLGQFLALRNGAESTPTLAAAINGDLAVAAVPCKAPTTFTDHDAEPQADSSLSSGLVAIDLLPRGVGRVEGALPAHRPLVLSQAIRCADHMSVDASGDWVAIDQRNATKSVNAKNPWWNSWVSLLDARTGLAVRHLVLGETIVDVWCCVRPSVQVRPP